MEDIMRDCATPQPVELESVDSPGIQAEYRAERGTPIGRVNKAHEITIRQLDHGYYVQVGCKTLAVESIGVLVDKLKEYLTNPGESESKLEKGEFF